MNEYKYDKNKVMMPVHCVGISAIQTRFILHIVANSRDEGRSILVVMKNPSKATGYKSDKTINNVINRLYTSYKHIYIANLFPYYSTRASGLLSCIEREDNDTILLINKMFIVYYLNKVDDILIGWGTNTIGMKQAEYEQMVTEVAQILMASKKPLYYVHCCICKTNSQGCGNNSVCTNRCKKKCSRGSKKKKTCSLVRFPMHLELWDSSQKIMTPY